MGKGSVIAIAMTAVLAGAPLAARAADASAQSQEKQGGLADKCSKDAFAKYPDYTPDSNVRREAWRRNCLRNHDIAAPDTPLPRVSGADQ
jgi:hypothetical protein